MLKYVVAVAMALAFGLPPAAGAVDLRDLAGCKPGADDPVVTQRRSVHGAPGLRSPAVRDSRGACTTGTCCSTPSSPRCPADPTSSRPARWWTTGSCAGSAAASSKVDLVMVNYEIAAARSAGLERAVEANSLPTVAAGVRRRRPRRQGRSDHRRHAAVRLEPPRGFALGFMKHFGMRDIDPARSLHRRRQGLSREHRHPLLPDLARRPRRAASRVDEGEESVIASARLHVLYQPVPAPGEADAAALLGRAGGLLRHRVPRLRHRATTAASRAASSSAIAWRRRTARRCCPIR